jgi:hypothetical protein
MDLGAPISLPPRAFYAAVKLARVTADGAAESRLREVINDNMMTTIIVVSLSCSCKRHRPMSPRLRLTQSYEVLRNFVILFCIPLFLEDSHPGKLIINLNRSWFNPERRSNQSIDSLCQENSSRLAFSGQGIRGARRVRVVISLILSQRTRLAANCMIDFVITITIIIISEAEQPVI